MAGIVGEVKVNTTVLKNKAQAVSRSIQAMERQFDQLERRISATSYYWVGEAGDQHRKLYAEQKRNVEEMIKRLKEHPTDLLTMAQIYDSAEAAVKSMAAGLPGDIIS